MAVYRFKIYFEDDEEILRLIEVRSSQTLMDLHLAYLQSIEFDQIHNSLIWLSNDHWKRGEQFAAMELLDKEVPLFSETKLSKIINDPHQKMLYVYDLQQEWSFHIELVGISIKEDSKVSYPLVVKKEGKAPKQYHIQRKVGADLEEDEFEYLTKNLLSGEIADEMLGAHLDEGEADDMDIDGDDDEAEETEDEFGSDGLGSEELDEH